MRSREKSKDTSKQIKMNTQQSKSMQHRAYHCRPSSRKISINDLTLNIKELEKNNK